METAEAPQLLRVDDVARRLGMSRRGVYSLVERGLLPSPLYLDRRPRFREEDVIRLVEGAPVRGRRRQER